MMLPGMLLPPSLKVRCELNPTPLSAPPSFGVCAAVCRIAAVIAAAAVLRTSSVEGSKNAL